VASFGGKTLGLYFSAHWCGPCRGFTPILAEFYAGKKDDLEIVFVSSDKSDAEFASYWGEHPWLALPYADRARRNALSTKFKVKGIPTLVLISPTGETLTTKGTKGLRENPAGFPWPEPAPLPLPTLLATASFVNPTGAEVEPSAVLEHEYIFLYFSAHWCGPCRAFTPELIKWYNKYHAAKNFELVFVSWDRDPAQFSEYHGSMPWPALTYQHPYVSQLNELFEVDGIPTLILIKADGTLVTKNARSGVTDAPEDFPWPPKPVESLSTALSFINDQKVAVLFLDKLTDDVALIQASEDFTVAGTELWDPSKAASPSFIRFALGSPDDGNTENVRQFVGLGRDKDGPASVRLIVLDIPGGVKFVYPGAGVPTAAQIKDFVASVAAGTAASVGVKAAP